MKKNRLQEYRKIHQQLVTERESVAKRLAEIDGALATTVQRGTPVVTRAEAAPRRKEPWRGKIASAQRERWARYRQQRKSKG